MKILNVKPNEIIKYAAAKTFWLQLPQLIIFGHFTIWCSHIQIVGSEGSVYFIIYVSRYIWLGYVYIYICIYMFICIVHILSKYSFLTFLTINLRLIQETDNIILFSISGPAVIIDTIVHYVITQSADGIQRFVSIVFNFFIFFVVTFFLLLFTTAFSLSSCHLLWCKPNLRFESTRKYFI